VIDLDRIAEHDDLYICVRGPDSWRGGMSAHEETFRAVVRPPDVAFLLAELRKLRAIRDAAAALRQTLIGREPLNTVERQARIELRDALDSLDAEDK
jgi:hypothetical protein